MLQAPFTPAGTQTMSATTASSSVTLPLPGMSVLRFYNAGPNLAFIRITTGASTAAITDMPLPVGVVESFSKGISADTVSAICGTGTAAVYVTQGEGA